jgi:hypothetical protein
MKFALIGAAAIAAAVFTIPAMAQADGGCFRSPQNGITRPRPTRTAITADRKQTTKAVRLSLDAPAYRPGL